MWGFCVVKVRTPQVGSRKNLLAGSVARDEPVHEGIPGIERRQDAQSGEAEDEHRQQHCASCALGHASQHRDPEQDQASEAGRHAPGEPPGASGRADRVVVGRDHQHHDAAEHQQEADTLEPRPVAPDEAGLGQVPV